VGFSEVVGQHALIGVVETGSRGGVHRGYERGLTYGEFLDVLEI